MLPTIDFFVFLGHLVSAICIPRSQDIAMLFATLLVASAFAEEPSPPRMEPTSITISPPLPTMQQRLGDRWQVDFSRCAWLVGKKAWVEFEITPRPTLDVDDVDVTMVRTEDRVYGGEGVWYCFAEKMRSLPTRWPTAAPAYTVKMTFEEAK